ncbi:MAG: hypothetical protein ACRBB3_00675 [Alphaproteobacteria bacterium]
MIYIHTTSTEPAELENIYIDTWYHVAVDRTNNLLLHYVDGELINYVDISTMTDVISFSGGECLIGKDVPSDGA